MIIKSAEFICSNTQISKLPPPVKPEYAFIGRSNVGKSSLINMLTSKKGLAKTSQTPGKTQLINHFLINDSWYIVDLPGYGYARASKSTKADKQSRVKTDQHVALFKKIMLASFDEFPQYFITSAELAAGHDELLNFISSVNQNFTIPTSI